MIFPSTACILQDKLGAHGGPGVRRAGRVLRLRLRARDRRPDDRPAARRATRSWSAPRSIRASSTGTTAAPACCSATAPVRSCSCRPTSPASLATQLHADGRYRDILCVPGQVQDGQGQRHAVRAHGRPGGVQVRGEGAGRGRRRGARGDRRCRAATIDWLIPHQANLRIMDATAKRLRHAARAGHRHRRPPRATRRPRRCRSRSTRRCATGGSSAASVAAARRRRRLHLGLGAACAGT